MKITLESTTKVVELNGVPARIWEGVTWNGVPCFAFITRIAPALDSPDAATVAEFERDLLEQRAPSPALAAIPLRMIL